MLTYFQLNLKKQSWREIWTQILMFIWEQEYANMVYQMAAILF